MRKIDTIIVHCTATKDGIDVSAADVDRYHRSLGFSEIGYHYLVRLDGAIEQGRALNRIGAHCKGKNVNSVGVAYVGGLGVDGKPADTRTEAQRYSLLKLIMELKREFPLAVVHSHRDFVAKACPCFDATNEYANI